MLVHQHPAEVGHDAPDKGIRNRFPDRIGAAVEVRVQTLTSLAAVQPALEPPPGELHLVSAGLSINRNEIPVQERRSGGVGLLMLDIADAQPLGPVLQLPAKLSKGQGYEVLVVLASYIGALLPIAPDTANIFVSLVVAV